MVVVVYMEGNGNRERDMEEKENGGRGKQGNEMMRD
jgi:hypothetical protein